MSSRKDRIFLGLDIGGTKCAVCLGTESGKILGKIVFPTMERLGPEQAIAGLLRNSRHLLAKARVVPSGIGISCGSPLDPDKGLIQSPANLPSWKEVPIVKIFKDEFRVPVFLDNDANAGAMAEHAYGAGKGFRNIAFLTFGTGMGSGLILDNRIYRGTNCYAGELGHFRLAPSGPVGCRKKGSFEGFCSGGGIAKLAEAELARHKGRTLLKKGATARDVGAAAEKGDALALSVLAISGRRLGQGLSYLIDLVNPERVIIGSIFLRCERFLRPEMEKTLRRECLEQTLSVCEIVPAGLGEKIGDYAAISVARHFL